MMKKYDKYIKTSLAGINEVPHHWNPIKLKFIGNLYSGLSGKSGDDFYNQENPLSRPYINFKNIAGNSTINPTQLDYVIINPDDVQNQVKKGDLFFLMSSENFEDIGKTAVLEADLEKTYLNSFCRGFRIYDDSFNPSFLNYLLSSGLYRQMMSIEAKGFTRINIQVGKIQNFQIFAPFLLEEQTKIVYYLDHQTAIIDQLIQQKKKLIELLREKRQAVIIESVTKGLNPNDIMKDSGIEWLGEVPETWGLIRLKFLYTIKKDIAGALGHYVLSVTQKGIKIKDLDNLKGQLSMDYSKYQLVNQGDFIMNHMDLLTGFVDISQWNGVTSPDYRVFSRIDERVCDRYFLYIFQFCYTNKIFFGLGQGVSQLGRWRMPSEQFNNFVVPLPSFEQQTEIVNRIESITKNSELLSTQLISQIEKLKEYRQSLISEAVTGKIDVRAWQPNKLQNA